MRAINSMMFAAMLTTALAQGAELSDGTIAEKARRLFGDRRGPDGAEGNHLLDKAAFADDPEMLLILDASLDGKVSEQEFVEFYQRSRTWRRSPSVTRVRQGGCREFWARNRP